MEPLNLHQVKVFQTVARHQSFSKAAQELFISQPAVSMHVKQLEKSLGLSLFEQIGKRIYLTEAGQALYDYSLKIFNLLDETRTTLEELRGMQRGSLNVAADTTAGVYVVPKYLGEFHRRYPDVNIALDVANRAQVHQRLIHNEIDLAVMGQTPEGSGLVVEPFLRNELVVIASPRHRLAQKRHVAVDDLRHEPFLLREPGSGTRATLERLFREAGAQCRVGMELGSNGAVKQAVANDLGLAVVSRAAIKDELATGRLVILNVAGFPAVRYWHVVHLRDKRLAAPALAFKELLLAGREIGPETTRASKN